MKHVTTFPTTAHRMDTGPLSVHFYAGNDRLPIVKINSLSQQRHSVV